MVPFQKITEACKTTGLSQYFLRQDVRMAQSRTSKAAACTTSTSRHSWNSWENESRPTEYRQKTAIRGERR